MKKLLEFMQSQDRNGSWLEWLEEIESGESDFDKNYVLEVLNQWHEESNDSKYLKWIERLKSV